MPLINIRKARLRVSRAVSSLGIVQATLRSIPEGVRSTIGLPAPRTGNEKGSEDDTATLTGPLNHLAPTKCPICFSTSTAPASDLQPGDPTDPTLGMFNAFPAGSSAGGADCDVRIPYEVDCCGGLYCYYCIVGRLAAWQEDTAGLDGGWPCLRCGQQVYAAKRANLQMVKSKE